MRTIIKNEDGTFWVRYCGMYVGSFATYKEAKKAGKLTTEGATAPSTKTKAK
jgi:hypothetical protein